MVYLIHFHKKYKHAQHYIGYCSDRGLKSRIIRHKTGFGARLLQVLNSEGIGYDVVRIWRGESRDFERKLKKRHKSSDICPVCNQKISKLKYRGKIDFKQQNKHDKRDDF